MELAARKHGAVSLQLGRADRASTRDSTPLYPACSTTSPTGWHAPADPRARSAHNQPEHGRHTDRPPRQNLGRLPGQQIQTRRSHAPHGFGPRGYQLGPAQDRILPRRTSRQPRHASLGPRLASSLNHPGPDTAGSRRTLAPQGLALPRLGHPTGTGADNNTGRKTRPSRAACRVYPQPTRTCNRHAPEGTRAGGHNSGPVNSD